MDARNMRHFRRPDKRSSYPALGEDAAFPGACPSSEHARYAFFGIRQDHAEMTFRPCLGRPSLAFGQPQP
jgi:hypothetical protein